MSLRAIFGLAVLPALMASTALAADLPQTLATPVAPKAAGLSLTGTVGVEGFYLPTAPTGVFSTGGGVTDPGVATVLAGGEIGFSAEVPLGDYQGYSLLGGISGFYDYAQGSSTVTDTFTGSGSVVIPGYTTPAAGSSITMDNSLPGVTPATADVTVVGPSGGSVVNIASPAGPNAVDRWDAHAIPGEGDFELGAATTNGATGVAGTYGAVATTDGGIFIANGDLTGLVITTASTSSLVYTGMDATITATGPSDGGVTFQAYGGPSYRYLDNKNSTVTSVDIPEVDPLDPSDFFPTYSMDREERITSQYLGGIFGINAVVPVGDNMTLALNGEGGLYYSNANLTGTESYNLVGGEPAGVTIPSTTVTNSNGLNLSANGMAYAARAAASLTVPLSDGLQVSFGGSLEYLSRVAYAARTNTSSVAIAADSASFTGGASSGGTSLGFGGMWDVGASISLGGHF